MRVEAVSPERLVGEVVELVAARPGRVRIAIDGPPPTGPVALARRTAEDLARTAAELERLGASRQSRLAGALDASQTAQGQTAAVQSTNQLLAVLAEDLAALRTLMLAQSRLMAEATAREAADRASGS